MELSATLGGPVVSIRTYRPGDESAQAEIFNEAAAALPRFKPATVEDVARRCRAPDFDPSTRLFAEADGRTVGYVAFHANGRVGFPWCRPGHEACAEALFAEALQGLAGRGVRTAFAAYRNDWAATREFFLAHGFQVAREMVNLVLDPVDMPTRPGTRRTPLTGLKPADVPAIFGLAPQCLRSTTPAELERHLFANKYFSAEAVFVLRDRFEDTPVAAGILVANPSYADPTQVDAAMPCYRLGAFGTEGMQTKRINGLFSFVARDDRDLNGLALDLMGHAASLLDEKGGGTLAAQVPSDVGHLLRFYQRYFRRQGSFPVFERTLST